MTTNPYRLSQSVWPVRYFVHLTPNLEAATFDGDLTVELDVRSATNTVAFNAIELELGDVTITDANGASHTATPVMNEEFETATVTLAAELPVGAATLKVAFTGILNDKLHGFYRSTTATARRPSSLDRP